MAFAAPRHHQQHVPPFPVSHVPESSRHNHASNNRYRGSAGEVAPPAVTPRPKFIHEGKIMTYDGDIFEKLLDPALYTGTHKHRFDAYGRGKGLYGRRDSHAILDAGAMFEEPGAAEDSATSCWKKSLRAAVHSFTVANQLGISGDHHHRPSTSSNDGINNEAAYRVGGAATAQNSSPRRRTATTAAQDTASSSRHPDSSSLSTATSAPVIQAWSLLDDGRLVFDEARTRELAAAQAAVEDGTADDVVEYEIGPASLLSGGESHHRVVAARRQHSAAAIDGSSAAQNRVDRPASGAAQQSRSGRKERPADVVKRQQVSSHFRRLLYDSGTQQDDSRDGRLAAAPAALAEEPAHSAWASAPGSTATTTGRPLPMASMDEFLPAERHSGDPKSGGRGGGDAASPIPESLEDIMALVRAYERNPFSSPHAAAEATRRTSGR